MTGPPVDSLTGSPTVLHVSPHPDDEVLGAGATLAALRDRGWRVVNLACSLGRPADRGRRRAELEAALRLLRFESEVVEPPVALGADDDLRAGEDRVAAVTAEAADRLRAALIISPGPEDAHHAHAAVGRGVARTGGSGGSGSRRWWAWSLWRDLERPTLYVPWDGRRLAELSAALACHAGELERNGYGDFLAARGRLQAVLGAERVFGFGSGPAAPEPYADLLTEWHWIGDRWEPGSPTLLTTGAPDHQPGTTRAISSGPFTRPEAV